MKALPRYASMIISSTLFLGFFATCSFGAAAPAKPAAKAAAVTPAPAAPAPAAATAKAGAEDAKGAAAAAAGPVNPKLDLVLKKQLDELKFKYEVNPEGTCRLIFNFGKERSHQVFVTSKKESFMGVEYRRVWATSMKSKEVPSADIMAKLLQDSVGKKIGAWELQHWSDGYRVILAAKIPADCSNTALQAAIKLVANGADFMEEDLTGGKDDF